MRLPDRALSICSAADDHSLALVMIAGRLAAQSKIANKVKFLAGVAGGTKACNANTNIKTVQPYHTCIYGL